MTRIALIIGALTALPVARADAPMNYMRTFGPAADPVTTLGWGLGIISLLVVVIITLLLLGGMFHKRPQTALDAAGRPAVSQGADGLPWIYIGVGLSTVVLFASAVWTFVTLAAVATPATKPALTLEVVGHQWWWEVNYLRGRKAPAFTTANEIHVPVGQPVRIHLRSADVIHSFWVPRLAGKTDLIPGVTNVTWLQADKPGVYRGQCGEYCGVQHAHMALEVVAQSAREFRAWAVNQARPATRPHSKAARRGKAVFQAHCSVCHKVQGTLAMGNLGPDLTHVMSRRKIAAGQLINNTGHLAGWIANAQAFKPGALMPTLTLSGRELVDVVSYVKTLK